MPNSLGQEGKGAKRPADDVVRFLRAPAQRYGLLRKPIVDSMIRSRRARVESSAA